LPIKYYFVSGFDGPEKSQFFTIKAQNHKESPVKNIQVFLCAIRDLCMRTTFYETVGF